MLNPINTCNFICQFYLHKARENKANKIYPDHLKKEKVKYSSYLLKQNKKSSLLQLNKYLDAHFSPRHCCHERNMRRVSEA